MFKTVVRIVFLFSLMIGGKIYSQLSVVSINSLGGGFSTHTIVDSVSVLHAYSSLSDLDRKNNRFLFCGSPNSNAADFYYYLVDMTTGNLISRTQANLSTFQTLLGLKYHQNTGILYGLLEENLGIQSSYFFIQIDPISGMRTVIDTIPFSGYVLPQQSHTFIHEDSSWYVFKAANQIITLDINTGNIVYNANYPFTSASLDEITALTYDDTTSTVYGLYWDDSKQMQNLISFNTTNGQFFILDSLLGIGKFGFATQVYALDSKNRLMHFQAADANDTNRLYTVDLNSKQVISSPVYDDNYSTDSILRPFFLHSDHDGGLFGLTYMRGKQSTTIEEVMVNGKIKLFPNPMKERITIDFGQVHQTIQLNIYSSKGKLIRGQTFKQSKTLIINRDNLNSGLYFFQFLLDGELVTKKVIVD